MPRPGLGKNADTNDAEQYYGYASYRVVNGFDMDSADMALYWASRLDPTWADPFYLRGMAIVQAYQKDAMSILWRTRSPRAARDLHFPEAQAHRVDSLLNIAWGRNPFLVSDFDRPPMEGGRDDPSRAAAHAYFVKQFAAAESLFAQVLKKHPDNLATRVYRARALFYSGRFDDAVRELEAARDTVHNRTDGTLSFIVPSSEMFDFAIGIALVQEDDFPAARKAFERALTSNLGFYWAHVRLAGSALKLHDTTTALTELDLAVQMEGHDPALRMFDGVVLHQAGREPAAAEQLQFAQTLDPYYAAPYYWLGEVYRAEGRYPDAINQFRLFLAHAARQDADRGAALKELNTLGVAPPDLR